jgi:hypothetical protein
VAEEISREALRREATVSMTPVTLDDVFVEIVGSSIEEEAAGIGDGGQEKGTIKE